MSKAVEERLANDARALESVALSDTARRELEGRLASARQASPAPQPERSGWLPLAAAAVALVAVVTVILPVPHGPAETGATEVAVTVPERDTVRPPMLGVADRLPIEAVSQTAPLEAEWLALQDDLERAREQIERDLPLRF
jgi:hypothetical protein